MMVKDRKGQALYETALVLFLFLVMMIGVVMIGPLVYTRLAVDVACYDCITAAVEAMEEDQGQYQGRTAAWQTLAGYRLDPTRASIYIWPDGTWDRGAQVTCRVTYRLRLGNLPGVSAFFGGGEVIIARSASLDVESYKSKWR